LSDRLHVVAPIPAVEQLIASLPARTLIAGVVPTSAQIPAAVFTPGAQKASFSTNPDRIAPCARFAGEGIDAKSAHDGSSQCAN
jgi:hypothetical protein